MDASCRTSAPRYQRDHHAWPTVRFTGFGGGYGDDDRALAQSLEEERRKL
jgi:hypothetical protein